MIEKKMIEKKWHELNYTQRWDLEHPDDDEVEFAKWCGFSSLDDFFMALGFRQRAAEQLARMEYVQTHKKLPTKERFGMGGKRMCWPKEFSESYDKWDDRFRQLYHILIEKPGLRGVELNTATLGLLVQEEWFGELSDLVFDMTFSKGAPALDFDGEGDVFISIPLTELNLPVGIKNQLRDWMYGDNN